jgi:copper homeostasis protein CutC
MNITVPPNTDVAFNVGTSIAVIQLGAGQVTIVAGSGVTIRNASTLKTRTQYSVLSLTKAATDTWYVAGDME